MSDTFKNTNIKLYFYLLYFQEFNLSGRCTVTFKYFLKVNTDLFHSNSIN